VKAAFKTPGFPRLYAGLAASMVGDSILLLVLSMWVKTLTGSNAQAGLTFFFMMVPALFAPLMGVWLDRVRRKPFLVWGNLASAVMVLPLVLVRDAGDVWLIWSVAFLHGVSFVVLPAALNGLLKEMVAEEHLVDANASLQTTKEAFRLFGPLLGAAIFAWTGGWLVALIDAATFAIAAAVIASIRIREDAPERDSSHLFAQIAAGLRHLVADRVLAHVLVGFGLTMLVLGFCEASIYALLDAFDKPATYAGVFVTIQGVGAIAGGLSAGWLIRRTGEVAASALGLVILAISMTGIAATRDLFVMLGCAGVMGLSLPLLTIGYLTLIQKRTPQAVMGRVSTAAEVVMSAPYAVSLAAGAALVSLLDYRVIFAIMGIVTMAGAAHIGFWLRDQIRTDWRTGCGGSVDEGLRPVGEDLLGEDGRARDAHALDHVAGGDAAALGALGTDGHLSLGDDGREQVR
jgi:MFS family permease